METIRISHLFIIAAALLIVFTSSNFFLFTWRITTGYYLIILFGSFLCGTVIARYDTSLIIMAITFITSLFVFSLLYISPLTLAGEAYPGEINVIIGLVAVELAKNIIISFPMAIFGCLLGSFSGIALTENY